jgi:hypothetical protein
MFSFLYNELFPTLLINNHYFSRVQYLVSGDGHSEKRCISVKLDLNMNFTLFVWWRNWNSNLMVGRGEGALVQ